MNKPLHEIVKDKLREQEAAVIASIERGGVSLSGHSIKRYKGEKEDNGDSVVFSQKIIICPKDDQSTVDGLTFDEASEKYPSAILNVTVKIENDTKIDA